MFFDELLLPVGLECPKELFGVVVAKITTDSREVVENSIFICVKGGNDDGHRYISEAISAGARVIVAENVRNECVGGAALLYASNTRNVASLLYNLWYRNPVGEMKFIGITGTNGKTSIGYMLLQILEDGILTDGQGNKVKFNNTVVILTSNLGAAEMYDDQEFGFNVRTKADEKKLAEEYEESKNAAMRELKKAMRPELINRLDSIEVFHALTRKQVEKIFDNLIEDLKKRLVEKSIGLKLDEDVKKFLIEKGYDPKNGARPLRRAIEDYLESELSELIISEGIKKGEIVRATLDKEKIVLKVEKKEK
jgi:hypothetical protein